MPIKILMPALSPTMVHGNLIKWLKKPNDYVKPGDVLAEIETDKANMELEAVEEGILGKIIVEAGTENVIVGTLIGLLLEEDESEDTLLEFQNLDIKTTTLLDEKTKLPTNQLINESTSDSYLSKEITQNQEILKADKRIFASPLARRIAIESNIDLSNISGSGPRGRIIKADIELAKVQVTQSVAPHDKKISRNNIEFDLVPLNNIKKIIANRLQESKQLIPHFYLAIDINIDKLLDIREDINQNFTSKNDKISINDFVVLAVAKSLREVKEINASWNENSIKYYNNIDISIAVATDYGLITPIIRNADQKNILNISKEIKQLIVKAKTNKLKLDEFQGGGFSISNLGMYGVKNFSAIINPPQSCILAVGAAIKKPVIINELIKIANIIEFTISCDHRVIDGADGAKFLSALKKYLEHPALILIEAY